MAKKEFEEKRKLTSEDKQILMEYMLNGSVAKEFKIMDTTFTIRTVTVHESIQAKKEMEGIKGSGTYMLNEYQVKLLRYSLSSFGDKEFESLDDVEKFIRNSGSQLVDKIAEAQVSFHNYIKELLDSADDFSVSPSSLED